MRGRGKKQPAVKEEAEEAPESEEEAAAADEKLEEAEAPAEKKEEKEAAAPAEKPAEEEIIDERIYTVPFRRVYWARSRHNRAKREVRVLREFVQRHMKPEGLLIQPEVNERIWARGIQRPPRKLRIRATKNSENEVKVYLAEA
jgi:large subunit ribosomal protein L31e